jgi:hypothetical protein
MEARSLKFLVVDDHPLVRDAMAHLHLLACIDPGVRVLEAADWEQGLALAHERRGLRCRRA